MPIQNENLIHMIDFKSIVFCPDHRIFDFAIATCLGLCNFTVASRHLLFFAFFHLNWLCFNLLFGVLPFPAHCSESAEDTAYVLLKIFGCTFFFNKLTSSVDAIAISEI